jgi:hypothetical protein
MPDGSLVHLSTPDSTNQVVAALQSMFHYPVYPLLGLQAF